MTHPIYTCLWFDGNAKAAADFYCSVFQNSKITSENPVVVNFELAGVKFMGLNGGPQFKPTPSISFFLTCDTDEEVVRYWDILREGGNILIPLDKYPWSEKYGWCSDKYGFTWQIFKGKQSEVKQKIVPLLMFASNRYGKTEEAIKFYVSLFKNSEIQTLDLYGKDAPQPEGKVMHSRFVLNNKVFMAMDGIVDHKFDYNEAISFVVECDTQEEIDFYWNSFTKEGQESMCGWCKDKFGVSWQIAPAILKTLMADPAKSKNVMEAFLKMRKFDIAKLMSV